MKHGNHKLFLYLILLFYSFGSSADLIEGQKVNLQILDKITAQIKNIEINVNNTHEYGTLKIEIYVCYKQSPEEIPEDLVLIRIFDISKDILFHGIIRKYWTSLPSFERKNGENPYIPSLISKSTPLVF